jgi:hypothetical protein
MTEQEYLLQEIHRIRLEYEKLAKPYIERLIYLRRIEQPSIYLTSEQAESIKEMGQA